MHGRYKRYIQNADLETHLLKWAHGVKTNTDVRESEEVDWIHLHQDRLGFLQLRL
jgi:hypothetical protein